MTVTSTRGREGLLGRAEGLRQEDTSHRGSKDRACLVWDGKSRRDVLGPEKRDNNGCHSELIQTRPVRVMAHIGAQ